MDFGMIPYSHFTKADLELRSTDNRVVLGSVHPQKQELYIGLRGRSCMERSLTITKR